MRWAKGYFGLFVLAMMVFAVPQANATIAYNAPAGTVGNQSWGGPLGMDFDTVQSISIDQLGVFDSGSNGLAGTLSARLYDRTNTAAPLATLTFTAADPGTLIGSHRFKTLATQLVLPAGFQGAIVADGFSGSDPNGNGLGNNFTTTDTGGGALSFVGLARYGYTAGTYPTGLDGGPYARYGAGSFDYSVIAAPPPPPPPPQQPGPVDLAQPTAIRSQAGFPIAAVIDGNTGSGWANGGPGDNTAAFESQKDIIAPDGARFTFTIPTGGYGTHDLGRFRLSVTGDDRSQFADGLNNGGDVTANWTVLDPSTFSSSNPTTTLTKLGNLSLLAGGTPGENETYTIVADSHLPLITGFRLEAIQDPSLPQNGPGRATANGNFVVYEFAVSYQPLVASVPEPATIALIGIGALGVLFRRTV